MSRRLKILLSAYACEPDKGSEPEVGWQWATRLAQTHEVTVVTRSNNQPAIQKALSRLKAPHPQFIFLDLPRVVIWAKKHGLPTTAYYVLWQIMIRWRLRQSLARFDLVHHLTFNSFLVPGFWWGVPGLLILGPLGGGQICPPGLLPLFGAGRVVERLRSILVRASQWSPIHHFNCHGASLILAANQDTARRIPPAAQPKLRLLLETAIAPLPTPTPSQSRSADPAMRILWVGRLEKRKALPLALHALAQATRSGHVIRLTVVGIGPDENALKQLANKLGLEAQVDWLGRRPRSEVDQLMATQDVFLFTSVRDTSGNVLLEAMRAGLPVITLNHQGAAEMTTDQTAVRITPTTLPETVQALAAACCALATDPERRHQLGRAGREHVLQFHTWERRMAQMNEIYAELAPASANLDPAAAARPVCE